MNVPVLLPFPVFLRPFCFVLHFGTAAEGNNWTRSSPLVHLHSGSGRSRHLAAPTVHQQGPKVFSTPSPHRYGAHTPPHGVRNEVGALDPANPATAPRPI